MAETTSTDDLAPESMVREAAVRWNPDAGLRIVAGADHFFGGKLDNLEKILSDFLKSTIAQAGINSYK